MSTSSKRSPPTATFVDVYQALRHAAEPPPDVVRSGFDAIFSGAWSGVQVAAFAVLLDRWPVTSNVLATAAEALRAKMVRAPIEPMQAMEPVLFDTCGTGGDGLNTLNISTAAAILLATTGVRVAKHGNRAASGRVGSADVLEALGIPLSVPLSAHPIIAERTGITFLFAPLHHRPMEFASDARKKLGVRTIFNLLGPLVNPAPVTHQLLGVADDGLRHPMAEALKQLGVSSAWVVHGQDGMDEVSPCGPTNVTVLRQGHITDRVITPEDFGLQPIPPEALAGGTAAHNAGVIEAILRNEPHPARNAVILNATAAALVLFPERALLFEPDNARQERLDKVELMQKALSSGRALDTLEHWRRDAALHLEPGGP